MFTCAHDGFVSVTIIDSGKCEKKRSRWFTRKIEASPPGPHSAMLKGCFGETRFTKASVYFARAGVSQNCINIESRGERGERYDAKLYRWASVFFALTGSPLML